METTMQRLTIDQLRRIMVQSPQERTDRFFAPMRAAMAAYDIDTPVRAAAFIAQVAHESGSFRYVREIASGRAYEGRKDLGNTQPGDGERFRGRGLIQVTGRTNYRACGQALGMDLEALPTLLETPFLAAISAGWFWNSRKLNAVADSGDFVALTRKINGGTNGLADRQQHWTRAKLVLGV